jgi:hypothetical protein
MAMTREEAAALEAQLNAWKMANQPPPQRGGGMSVGQQAQAIGTTLGAGGLAAGAGVIGSRVNDTRILNKGLREMGAAEIPKFSMGAIAPKSAVGQDRKAQLAAARDLMNKSTGARATAKGTATQATEAQNALNRDIEDAKGAIKRNQDRINKPGATQAEIDDATAARDKGQSRLDGYETAGRKQIADDLARRTGYDTDAMGGLTNDYDKARGAPAKARAAAELARKKRLAKIASTGRNAALLGMAVAFWPAVSVISARRAAGQVRGSDNEMLDAAIDVARTGGELSEDQISTLKGSMDPEAFENLLDLNGAVAEDPSQMDAVDEAVNETMQMPTSMQEPDMNALADQAQMLEDSGDLEGAQAARDQMTQMLQAEEASAAGMSGGPEQIYNAQMMVGDTGNTGLGYNDGSVGPTMQNAEAQQTEAPEMEDEVAGYERIAAQLLANGDEAGAAEFRGYAQEAMQAQQIESNQGHYASELERQFAPTGGADANFAQRMMYRSMSGQPTFGEDTPLTNYSETLRDLDPKLDHNLGDTAVGYGAPQWLGNVMNFGEDTGRGLALGAIDPATYVDGPMEMIKGAYGAARDLGMGPAGGGRDATREEAYYSDDAQAQQEREMMAQQQGDAAFNAEGRGQQYPMQNDTSLGEGDPGMNQGNLTFQDLLNYRDQGILGGDPVQIAQDMGIEVPAWANGPRQPQDNYLDTLGDQQQVNGMQSGGTDMAEYMQGARAQEQAPQMFRQNNPVDRRFFQREDPGAEYPTFNVDQPMQPEMDGMDGYEGMGDTRSDMAYVGTPMSDMPALMDPADRMSAGDDSGSHMMPNGEMMAGQMGSEDNMGDAANLPKIRQMLIEGDEAMNPRGQTSPETTTGGFNDGGLNSSTNPERDYTMSEPGYQPTVDDFARTPDEFARQDTDGAASAGLGSGRASSDGATSAQAAGTDANGRVGDYKASKGLADDTEGNLNWIQRQMRDRLGMKDEGSREDFIRALGAFGSNMGQNANGPLGAFAEAGNEGVQAAYASRDSRREFDTAAEQQDYDRWSDSMQRQMDQDEYRRKVASDSMTGSLDGLKAEKLNAEIARIQSQTGKLPSQAQMIDYLTEEFMLTEEGMGWTEARRAARDLAMKSGAVDGLMAQIMAAGAE